MTSSYWDEVEKSYLIVSLGSSSLYELYSMGASQIVICDFFGRARSSKFSMFPEILISDEKTYQSLFDGNQIEKRLSVAGLRHDVFKAYSSLFSERVTHHICSEIIS